MECVYIGDKYTYTKGADVKKFLIMAVMALCVAGFCTSGFAAKVGQKSTEKKYDRMVAEVVSVDLAAKTMVVKREENGETRTITISEKAASQLHVGDRVRVKLNPGTNVSVGVRILGAKPVASDAAAEPAAKAEVQAGSK
jgi:hypothetical protein